MPTQAERFATCVKDVKKKVKTNRKLARNKESAAIAICTRAILWPQGRTIKRFSMEGKKARLVTQRRNASHLKKSG